MLWLISTVYAAVVPSNTIVNVLDNGMTVVILKQEETELVAVQTWMRVGSRHETQEGTSGYAHFFEHLMFQGTEMLSKKERKRELMLLSADENAWTSQDFTCYHLLAPAAGVDRLLEIESDRFQNLLLTEAMVQREAGAVLGEFRKGRNSADNAWQEEIRAQAYQVHGYGHSTIGYEEDVRGMPSGFDKVQQFYSDHYRPSNTVLVVVGGIDPDEILHTVEALYGDWSIAGEVVAVPPPVEPAQMEQKNVELEWSRTPVQPKLSLHFKTPAPNPAGKEYAALQILASVLSSESTVLFDDLVFSEEAPARAIWARASHSVDPALFSITVLLHSQADIAVVEERLYTEFQRLEQMDASLLEQHKQALMRSAKLRLSSPDRWAFQLGGAVAQYNDVESIDHHLEMIKAVSVDDVSEVIQLYFQPEKMVRATLTEGAE